MNQVLYNLCVVGLIASFILWIALTVPEIKKLMQRRGREPGFFVFLSFIILAALYLCGYLFSRFFGASQAFTLLWIAIFGLCNYSVSTAIVRKVKPGEGAPPLESWQYREQLDGIKSIAAGGQVAAALKENGDILVWGDNKYEQCNVPSGLGAVKQISVGGMVVTVLLEDGTVVEWPKELSSYPKGWLTSKPYPRDIILQSPCFRRCSPSLGFGLRRSISNTGRTDGVKAISSGIHHTVALMGTAPYRNGAIKTAKNLSYQRAYLE
jgi:hypothetical protein